MRRCTVREIRGGWYRSNAQSLAGHVVTTRCDRSVTDVFRSSHGLARGYDKTDPIPHDLSYRTPQVPERASIVVVLESMYTTLHLSRHRDLERVQILKVSHHIPNPINDVVNLSATASGSCLLISITLNSFLIPIFNLELVSSP